MASTLDYESYLDLEAKAKDAPSLWNGAPPNWGKDVISHIDTIAGAAGLWGNAYLNADEAVQQDPRNSERMRADCGIMECLEGRYRASALLKWHIEPSNPKSLEQKQLAEIMTRLVGLTPDFIGYRIWLNEAIYFGRSGIAEKFSSEEVDGYRRTVLSRWEPRHGDKFVFRMVDDIGRLNPDQIGIRIGTMSGRYVNNKQVEPTTQGMVYWFNSMERKTVALHKHMREDGPFEDPYAAGRIHGYGVRSRIYWTWYAMVECMQRALEYLDRSAFGVELWRYPGNSAQAKLSTEVAAKRVISGGRSIVLVPTFTGDMADSYGVEHIEPGLAGFDRLLQVIKEVFQLKIKRYILGQTLTSEAESTGLGSGVADAHMATFADIVHCDAQRLAESITVEYLRNLQLWNFPSSRHIRLDFKIDTESDQAAQRMEAIEKAYKMGMRIRLEDISAAAGVGIATENEEVVFNPQLLMGMEQYKQQKAGILPPQMPQQQPPGKDQPEGEPAKPVSPPVPLPDGNPFKDAISRALAA